MEQTAAPVRARRNTHGPKQGLSTKAGLATAAAAALLAAAVGNHFAARRTERRNPPAGRFVTIDGVRLHYLEQGQGPTLVLIHGNGVTAQDYVLSGLFDRLARSYRVIAFDRPGFGYSERPRDRPWTAADQARLLLAALTELDVDRAVLVGHSWGTMVAVQAALEEPDRIHGLVLMSGYFWPTPRVDVPLLSGPAIPGVGDVMRFTVSPLVGRLMTPLVMKQIFSPAKVPPHFKEGFAADMSLRPSQLRATAADTAMMPMEAARLAPRLKEVTGPVLIMSGDGDKIVSFKHQSRRLARELLGGQIEVIEGAGHMIHHTAPAQVAAGIEAFLGEIGFATGSLAELAPSIAREPLPA
jgi:pimeloyl-ACP methyl ester carboxylesterase